MCKDNSVKILKLEGLIRKYQKYYYKKKMPTYINSGFNLRSSLPLKHHTLSCIMFPLMELFLYLLFWDSEPRRILLDFSNSLKSSPFQMGFDFFERGKGHKEQYLENMVAVGYGECCSWPQTDAQALVTDEICSVMRRPHFTHFHFKHCYTQQVRARTL